MWKVIRQVCVSNLKWTNPSEANLDLVANYLLNISAFKIKPLLHDTYSLHQLSFALTQDPPGSLCHALNI